MESLLVSDPRRFLEHVLRDHPRERWDGLETLDDVFLCETLRFGIHSETAMMPDLQQFKQFYGERFLPLPLERRRRVYQHVVDMVESVDFVSADAFLPFIAGDDDRGLVATAVVDYVSLAPVSQDDPMSEVRKIVGMTEGRALNSKGAAFGGLLHLGDPRVCELIWPLRDTFDDEELREVVNCQTGYIAACTAEFYIDWLEGMRGDVSDGPFGLVASGLAWLRKRSPVKEVFTGHRPFPFTKSVSSEEFRALAEPIPFADYQQRIALRLYDLERTEPPPKVMPVVLSAWGLEPHSDPSDRANLDTI